MVNNPSCSSVNTRWLKEDLPPAENKFEIKKEAKSLWIQLHQTCQGWFFCSNKAFYWNHPSCYGEKGSKVFQVFGYQKIHKVQQLGHCLNKCGSSMLPHCGGKCCGGALGSGGGGGGGGLCPFVNLNSKAPKLSFLGSLQWWPCLRTQS